MARKGKRVEDRHDMGLGAQPSHGLGLPQDAAAGVVVQALSLDQREGDKPVFQGQEQDTAEIVLAALSCGHTACLFQWAVVAG